MKKFCTFLMIVLFAISCRYDDTDILAQLQDHEARIARLETLVNQINTNVISLQTLLVALQNNDYVTSIAPINEGGVEIGYTMTFAKSDPVTIYHGRDGKDGADGKDGMDGKDGIDGVNGKDGADGSTPVIGVRQDEDGGYYWTLNGEWLTDDEGNKIPVTGNDGADGVDGNDGQDGSDGKDGVDGINGTDGAPGADGKDGITPQLKIEDDYWYVSYDGGENWTQVGKATGDAGADGTDGKDGIDGKDGVDGDTIFAEIDSSNADYVVFTLTDGTVIKLPTWKAFEELQTKVNEINANLVALQAIVEALQNNDYVTSITPITENRIEIGYVINFSKSLPVTIYHGKDGTDGADGKDGADGANGKDGLDGDDGQDGEDGHSPLISVKQDEDGVYYWTLDGEWLTDESGNRIPTTGKDGADGENGAPGQDGNDGVTPQLKIEDGCWWLKTTGEWQKLGLAKGDKGDSSFEDVSVNEWAVVLTLQDGTVFTVPRRSHMEMSCELTELKNTTAKFSGTIFTNSPDIEVGIIYSYTDTNVKKQDAHTVSTYEFSSNGEFTVVLENLNSVAVVYYRTYVYMNGTYSYSDVKSFETGNITLDGVSANCYIVTESGSYSFPAVRGNSSASVGEVMSAEVLWESFGTSVAPTVGDLIKSVSYSDGIITYQTADVFKEGNAVIAAKDASGVILWSWHIWLVGDSMQSQIYANDAGVMMDRNLGATSATPGDVGALGLLYQWGRKDPFLGSSSISASTVAASTLSWPSAVSSSSSTGTIAYSIANPTKFINGIEGSSSTYGDWLYSSRNNELWSTYKSIYDPCPAGWRVPDSGIWSKAGFDDTAYDSINRGMMFAYPISTPDAWFPAAGVRDSLGGSLNSVGSYGNYWSATPGGTYAYVMKFCDNGDVYPSTSSKRAAGYSVRCLKE